MSRRPSVIVLAVLALAVMAAPVAAQNFITVSVTNPSFSWTGKQDQQAMFSWSATVENPSKRQVPVRVTMQLLDAAGNVVGSDAQSATVTKEGRVAVGNDGMLAYAEAARATQYRIVLEGVES